MKSDRIYQNAIEQNYSHEYNTPLNCIISNSLVIKNELKRILRHDAEFDHKLEGNKVDYKDLLAFSH